MMHSGYSMVEAVDAAGEPSLYLLKIPMQFSKNTSSVSSLSEAMYFVKMLTSMGASVVASWRCSSQGGPRSPS
eukprot:10214717-Lingulodinium_polyedra.AAC.1